MRFPVSASRPGADEAPRHMREKTSGTQGTPLKAWGEAFFLTTVTSSTKLICFLRKYQ